jgi:hypothetical protein
MLHQAPEKEEKGKERKGGREKEGDGRRSILSTKSFQSSLHKRGSLAPTQTCSTRLPKHSTSSSWNLKTSKE